MHQETLEEIAKELEKLLSGRFLGRIFQLSAFSLAIDFGLKAGGYLFVNADPAAPRLYLIKRRVKELEKGSVSPSAFAQAVRAKLGGGALLSARTDQRERVVRFAFSVSDELGVSHTRSLIAQLTGRSANLFLLDSEGTITHALRTPKGSGQQVGERYRAPILQATSISEEPRLTRGGFPTISAAADEHYGRLDAERDFKQLSTNLAAKLRRDIGRRKRLRVNLRNDLVAHGNPEAHKRLGELLFANITTAKRDGNKVKLKDYYAEGAPTIEIEIDQNSSLQDAASESFSRYAKAKRAIEEIGTRLVQLERELEQLEAKQANLEKAIASRDQAALVAFDEKKDKVPSARRKQRTLPSLRGMRRYRSSDGYEVLVGRTSRDNDQLTFRVARPNDLWLHASDYPGSHVIVRNSSRNEIPHRTIIEAAQLAARFSQAGKDAKVTIHYAPRKLLSKPKGVAPGLVRMSSFRSITVKPGENIERL